MADLIDDVGGECWAAGTTAGALHLFDHFELAPPYHLVVLRGRFLHRLGHVIHTTNDMPLLDRTTAFGLPVVAATRTIVDLARTETMERLTLAIDSATRDGTTSDDFLHRRLVEMRGRGRHGIPMLLDALQGIEIARGGHSWLEREFLRLLASSGLPRPLTQQVMGRRAGRLIRVDCFFEGTPIVVELLGYAFHRTQMQMNDDASRMNRLQLDGRIVLQFTYLDVTERPEHVVTVVAEALHAARTRALTPAI